MTGETRTLLLPSDASARKYVDNRIASGVRGTAEESLRIIRGRVDTTGSGSILQGDGFTIARNGTGDVTVTFTTAFSAIPAVVPTAESDTSGMTHIGKVRTVAAGSVRLQRNLAGVSDQDGIMHFIAVGPA